MEKKKRVITDFFFSDIIRKLKIRWEKFPVVRYSFYFSAVFILLVMLLSFSSLFPRFFVNPFVPEIGHRCPINIIAQKSIEVKDELATQEAIQRAKASIPLIYRIHQQITQKGIREINQVFQMVKEVKSEDIPKLREISILRKMLPFISQRTFQRLLESPEGAWQYTHSYSVEILRKIMNKGIKRNQIPQARIMIERMATSLPIPQKYADVVRELDQDVIKPNQFVDWEARNRKVQQIEEHFRKSPIYIRIEKGDLIVPKGKIVTRYDLNLLQQLGVIYPTPTLFTAAGMGILSLLCLGILVLYLSYYHPEFLKEEKNLFLFAGIFLLTILLIKVTTHESGYFAPIAAASILVAILFDARLSLIETAVLSLYVGLLTSEVQAMIVAFVGGAVSVFVVSKVSNRFHLVNAIFSVTIATEMTIISFFLIENQSGQLLRNMLWGIWDGVLGVGIPFFILPFIEHFSEIATPFRLLELANPNEPLLREFLVEAPGSYHHSMIVANLAENAAHAIKADSLLVRAGAYYHDIGKMRRPYFFIENQMGGENPHDKLNPSLSTLIVTSHTKDGLELARSHKLPKKIQDIIVQHHGTRVVNYFYHQAVMKEGIEKVNRDDYRHEGPKPQTKEAAVLMLSDTVEAATRSLPKPSHSKIEQTVKQVVREVMLDGQLDESNLSFNELNILIDTFIRLLSGMYHNRIQYPDLSKIQQPDERQGQTKGKVLQFGN